MSCTGGQDARAGEHQSDSSLKRLVSHVLGQSCQLLFGGTSPSEAQLSLSTLFAFTAFSSGGANYQRWVKIADACWRIEWDLQRESDRDSDRKKVRGTGGLEVGGGESAPKRTRKNTFSTVAATAREEILGAAKRLCSWPLPGVLSLSPVFRSCNFFACWFGTQAYHIQGGGGGGASPAS